MLRLGKKTPEIEFLRLNIFRYTSPESRKKNRAKKCTSFNSIELIQNIPVFFREEEGRASCNSNEI